MSKIHTKLGVIGQILTVIGLAAALAACDDPSSSAGTAGSSAGANAAASVASSSASTPAAATTATSGESKPVSSTSSSSGSSSSTSSEPQSVTLAWDAPTQNTDGSALTNLQGYEIYYGTSSSSLTQKISIGTTGQQNYVVENLTAGTWYFEVVAINAAGEQSGPSSIVSVTLS
jgi:hypothetical protein